MQKIAVHVYRVILSGNAQIHGIWTCEEMGLKMGVPTRQLIHRYPELEVNKFKMIRSCLTANYLFSSLKGQRYC